MTPAAIVATALILASGICTWGLIYGAEKWLRGLGDYANAIRSQTASQDRFTGALLAVHESNQLLVGENAKLWAAIQHAKTNGKVA